MVRYLDEVELLGNRSSGMYDASTMRGLLKMFSF